MFLYAMKALAFTFGFLAFLFLLLKLKRDWFKEESSIDMSLVVIGLLPFAAYLVFSGQVKELGVGEITVSFIETARATGVIAAVAEAEKTIPLVIEDASAFRKGGLAELRTTILPRFQTKRFTTMIIDSRPSSTYVADAILEYLNTLGHYDFFKYVVFLENGQFQGWMRVSNLKLLLETKGREVEEWINRRDFGAMKREGMHTEKISSAANSLEALNALNKANEDNIAILDDGGNLLGITSRESIVSHIVAQTLVQKG